MISNWYVFFFFFLFYLCVFFFFFFLVETGFHHVGQAGLKFLASSSMCHFFWQCWKLDSPTVARITQAVWSAAADLVAPDVAAPRLVIGRCRMQVAASLVSAPTGGAGRSTRERSSSGRCRFPRLPEPRRRGVGKRIAEWPKPRPRLCRLPMTDANAVGATMAPSKPNRQTNSQTHHYPVPGTSQCPEDAASRRTPASAP